MLAVLAFLRSPLGRYVMIGAAVLTVVLVMRSHWIGQGRIGEQRAEAVREKAAEARVAQREQTAAEITKVAQAALSARQAQAVTITRTLIQKVPQYVTAKADAGCVVPVGFVRLHDAAASGNPASLPSAPGGSIEAASRVPLSAVTETVIGNYGVAYSWRAEVQAWRDWYGAQKAAFDRP